MGDRFRAEADKGTKVYIGNIPPDSESHDLREFFRGYGTINDAWVARKPPGFGFVFFEHEKDARDAVWDLNGRDLRGNRVRVEISKPRAGSPRRGPPKDSYRDERSPRRGNGRGRSPSPRYGGGRSPRARSPFREREDSRGRAGRDDGDRKREDSRDRKREDSRDRKRDDSRDRKDR
eukprot:CAMPEP_0113661810 /NCGR_PEP_ID=MMETSP0038_2-20120614/197_1 /TAXON_ID=2898 /ORGANISM="Cryptomonas paramecium" /LENGTH=176 /DNA_ID=CAMNT_0000576575 /DNA_START=15 /DNA_END=541 /DNA_ORIENTATION=- /assembly_acc=CAM_ASM_000170